MSYYSFYSGRAMCDTEGVYVRQVAEAEKRQRKVHVSSKVMS